jgi:transglutaminase-like putative cysteine protease
VSKLFFLRVAGRCAGLLLAAGPGATATRAGVPPKYPVADIAGALRENAHAVVRLSDETLTVKSAARLVETVHRAITVLDEAGAVMAKELVYYDQLRTVSYFRGAVYDADGHLLRVLKASDIKDIALSDGFSLANDNRGRFADLRQPVYPYTVEFEYEVSTANTLAYPSWQPQTDEQVAIEHATFRVLTPATLPLRYQERNLPAGATVARGTQPGNLETYEWQVHQLAAVEEEPDGPPVAATTPAVFTAPGAFELQGHAGSGSSWQQLGAWGYALNAGRDALPPEAQVRMAALAQAEPDQRQRVRKVYEWLQANTRYISVQLGIGGYQTFPALSVASNGYGDCKALSNYCQALLKAAGLPSYSAWVGAGASRPDVEPTFARDQFNHVILCVPLQQAAKPDTVWLECTSQTNPFGYMSSFTGNRHALLLTPQGGRLVRTPQYLAADNRRERLADVYVDAQGSATASIRTRRTGLEQDAYAGLAGLQNLADQKKVVAEHLPLANFSISKLSYTQDHRRPVPVLTETLGLALPGWASVSGKRAFLTPNLLSRWSALPATVGERRTPIWLDNAFSYADTVRIHVPAGFKAESLPAPVQLSTAFGTYSSQVQALPDGTLLYVRRLLVPRTRFPRTDYPAYQDFRRRISQADKAQVVLLKTDA